MMQVMQVWPIWNGSLESWLGCKILQTSPNYKFQTVTIHLPSDAIRSGSDKRIISHLFTRLIDLRDIVVSLTRPWHRFRDRSTMIQRKRYRSTLLYSKSLQPSGKLNTFALRIHPLIGSQDLLGICSFLVEGIDIPRVWKVRMNHPGTHGTQYDQYGKSPQILQFPICVRGTRGHDRCCKPTPSQHRHPRQHLFYVLSYSISSSRHWILWIAGSLQSCTQKHIKNQLSFGLPAQRHSALDS